MRMNLVNADILIHRLELSQENIMEKVDVEIMLAEADTVPAIPVPDNATNGDMIKTMFPNIHMDNECNGVLYGYTSNDPQSREVPMLGVNLEWWNTPYKMEAE